MRVEGWESLLAAHLDRARDAEFAWGVNDCALWSADWVAQATGNDFAAPWRGRYASEAELHALLAGMDIDLPADIADEVGLPRVEVPFARRGDVVLDPRGCLGVCDGLYSHFLMERGVTRLKTRLCTRAWAVG